MPIFNRTFSCHTFQTRATHFISWFESHSNLLFLIITKYDWRISYMIRAKKDGKMKILPGQWGQLWRINELQRGATKYNSQVKGEKMKLHFGYAIHFPWRKFFFQRLHTAFHEVIVKAKNTNETPINKTETNRQHGWRNGIGFLIMIIAC